MSPVSGQHPRVLVSYSHDSPEHRAQVLEMTQSLRRDGIDAWIDRFAVVPPRGWPLWMEDQVQRAQFVLAVCTPTYKKRFEAKDAPGQGRGVTWEGAIIRRKVYNDSMSNTWCIPVLLGSGASEAGIPDVLHDTTMYRWEADREPLLRRLTDQPAIQPVPLGELPDLPSSFEDSASGPLDELEVRSEGAVALDGSVPESGSGSAPMTPHERMTLKRLSDPFAARLVAMLAACADDFGIELGPGSPDVRTLVAHLGSLLGADPEVIRERFIWIRRSLARLADEPVAPAERAAIGQAAAAMYWLAALALVERSAAAASTERLRASAIEVTSDVPVLCAIISTALFGGRLHVDPSDTTGTPRPGGVKSVRVPPAGEERFNAFLREVYAQIFEGRAAADEVTLDTRPLEPQRLSDLRARIESIRLVREENLVLVVTGIPGSDLQDFAAGYRCPTLAVTEAASSLFAVDEADLDSVIREFYSELREWHGPGEAR